MRPYAFSSPAKAGTHPTTQRRNLDPIVTPTTLGTGAELMATQKLPSEALETPSGKPGASHASSVGPSIQPMRIKKAKGMIFSTHGFKASYSLVEAGMGGTSVRVVKYTVPSDATSRSSAKMISEPGRMELDAAH
ncbi:MAG: hypothetical protein FRX49_09949 [Trebouxia sp. A1-2]|nr:MAG: hypothetical protein FRX49_09949 [Trebouxia sp. A1-2]